MNLDSIELLLVEKLRRLFRKQAEVLAGPVSSLPLGGMQETIFIHAVHFVDHNGATSTSDGASIARRPFKNGRVTGLVEERPCHIVLEVSCIATTYNRIKTLSGEISPEVLLILACEREFELGVSANRQSSLKFTDFQVSLNQMETTRQEDDELVYHMAGMTFHLNGALHVQLSKYGGLKSKPQSLKKSVVKKEKELNKKSRSVNRSRKPKKSARK
jgi:hypothetical protein